MNDKEGKQSEEDGTWDLVELHDRLLPVSMPEVGPKCMDDLPSKMTFGQFEEPDQPAPTNEEVLHEHEDWNGNADDERSKGDHQRRRDEGRKE